MKKQIYQVAKNPNDHKWYAMGYCGTSKGKSYYMPVSYGFESRGDAEKWAKRQILADKDAIRELAACENRMI